MPKRALLVVLTLCAACGGTVDGAGILSPPDTSADDTPTDPPPDVDLPIPDPPAPAKTGVFVAVGYGGRTMRSLDGALTWVDDQALVEDGGDDDKLLRTVTFGNGQFISLGWRAMTSPDGKTWTDHGTTGMNWVGSVRYNDSAFVGVGGYGLRIKSADGASWDDHHIDRSATHPDDALAWGDGYWVSANDSGVRSYSQDGAAWTYSESLSTVATFHVAYGAGVFVSAGANAILKSSDHGVTWTNVLSLEHKAGGIVYAQDHFTVTASGHTYTSADGTTWVDHADASYAEASIFYGGGIYVMPGWKSLRRSTDGLTWNAWSSTGQTNSIAAVAYGEIDAE